MGNRQGSEAHQSEEHEHFRHRAKTGVQFFIMTLTTALGAVATSKAKNENNGSIFITPEAATVLTMGLSLCQKIHYVLETYGKEYDLKEKARKNGIDDELKFSSSKYDLSWQAISGGLLIFTNVLNNVSTTGRIATSLLSDIVSGLTHLYNKGQAGKKFEKILGLTEKDKKNFRDNIARGDIELGNVPELPHTEGKENPEEHADKISGGLYLPGMNLMDRIDYARKTIETLSKKVQDSLQPRTETQSMETKSRYEEHMPLDLTPDNRRRNHNAPATNIERLEASVTALLGILVEVEPAQAATAVEEAKQGRQEAERGRQEAEQQLQQLQVSNRQLKAMVKALGKLQQAPGNSPHNTGMEPVSSDQKTTLQER